MRALLPWDIPFDYQLVMDRLADYAAPRDKLRRLCAQGEIGRVKKGLYTPLEEGRSIIDPLVLSGLVYGPSYVSRETALAIHGLIPERVEEITCMTSLKEKRFRTLAGRFSYRVMPKAAFAIGVGLAEARGGTYLLACPEKALCDRVGMVRGLTGIAEVEALLVEDLRIDSGAFAGMDTALVRQIANVYGRRNVRILADWLEEVAR
ncbi:MAG: hypothetical protein WCP06_08375 [Verrucomicrobiota bacterium]